MLCAHTRQAWLPCAHADCPQGTEAPTITRIVGRAGARRAVTFTASPMGRSKVTVGEMRWMWMPTRTEFFLEIVLAGGRYPSPAEMLRAQLGLA